MADNLFAPPPKYVLPLSKGGDLVVEFLNDPDGDGTYTDFDAGVTVTLVIEAATPVEADADVSGHTATVRVESDVADDIPTGKAWRVVVSSPTDPSTEKVAANGKTKRFDA